MFCKFLNRNLAVGVKGKRNFKENGKKTKTKINVQKHGLFEFPFSLVFWLKQTASETASEILFDCDRKKGSGGKDVGFNACAQGRGSCCARSASAPESTETTKLAMLALILATTGFPPKTVADLLTGVLTKKQFSRKNTVKM